MQTLEKVKCYHCGQRCPGDDFRSGDFSFCCYGCQVIYDIIHANDLCGYYDIQHYPGHTAALPTDSFFAYLDEKKVRETVVDFDSQNLTRVTFLVPAIHCSSCIWLLEHLERLNDGVIKSEVNFGKKLVSVAFNPNKTKLSSIAAAMNSLGYKPVLSLDNGQQEKNNSNTRLLIQLGVAGFCFGNVMLFSFPEYLGLDPSEGNLGKIFSWLNLLLSVPVLAYSAADYFTSTVNSLKQKQVNIDVPIAFGLLALFSRSALDIVNASGPGYLDSFTGLVFFLLIGRWFQNKTYENLSFERDYKSYFPLAIQRLHGNEYQPVHVDQLKRGDRIRVRNLEIVPSDSVLLDRRALIDYSFVSGEAEAVHVVKGSTIFAGGRVTGHPVDLVVEKPVSQSHLTKLWNNEVFRKREESNYKKVIDRFARNFTWIVLGIAAGTAVTWYFLDPASMWLVLTSVLMVACPCALALAAPFTYGNMLRIFGQHQFYLKNADVIERLASVNAVVFDKTGTVTHGREPSITFEGFLSDSELANVKMLTSYSTHPLSTLIGASIDHSRNVEISGFEETPGGDYKELSAVVSTR
jgi:Cu+-exporting ATPase